MKIHDQTSDRHIINVPMPFTESGLKYIVAQMNGWEDDPELVQDYVDAIISEGRVDLNPSSALGEGANIVDAFSFGLMAIAKHWNMPAPDINDLWIHPMRNQLVLSIKSIEVEQVPCGVNSNEFIMTKALTSDGQIITANEASLMCPGNSDNLEAYSKKTNNDDELPF